MTKEDKIKRWLADELSESENQDFERSDEFAEIHRLMNAVQNFKAPEYNIDHEHSKLTKTLVNQNHRISLLKRISPALRIAAVFIITLMLGYFAYNSFNPDLSTTGSLTEINEVLLPDSSYVILNAESTIKYSNEKWHTERNVTLKGEAFFRVKKGSQFNVQTPQGTVTVLGTQFGVKDWDNYYEVICYSGSVKVTSDQKTLVLKPGDAFRVIDGNNEEFSVADQTKPEWINGESSFNSTPLSFVFKELERQYQVKIISDHIDLNQRFTGSFTNNNLKIALESITIPVNLRYEIKGNKIVITLEDK